MHACVNPLPLLHHNLTPHVVVVFRLTWLYIDPLTHLLTFSLTQKNNETRVRNNHQPQNPEAWNRIANAAQRNETHLKQYTTEQSTALVHMPMSIYLYPYTFVHIPMCIYVYVDILLSMYLCAYTYVYTFIYMYF